MPGEGLPSGRERAIETLIDSEPNGAAYRAARILVSAALSSRLCTESYVSAVTDNEEEKKVGVGGLVSPLIMCVASAEAVGMFADGVVDCCRVFWSKCHAKMSPHFLYLLANPVSLIMTGRSGAPSLIE